MDLANNRQIKLLAVQGFDLETGVVCFKPTALRKLIRALRRSR